MSTPEEVRQLIAGLPDNIRAGVFNEFSLELTKLNKWTDKTKAFGEEIGKPKPGEPGFGDALNQWITSKTEGVVNRMVDRLLVALRQHYGAITVTKEDIEQTIKLLMNEVDYK